jgi:hypothetical protein
LEFVPFDRKEKQKKQRKKKNFPTIYFFFPLPFGPKQLTYFLTSLLISLRSLASSSFLRCSFCKMISHQTEKTSDGRPTRNFRRMMTWKVRKKINQKEGIISQRRNEKRKSTGEQLFLWNESVALAASESSCYCSLFLNTPALYLLGLLPSFNLLKCLDALH